ncbi:hypothetical protein [Nevskia sp.]|uniref:hypothetical protein n=1 Tax=Nevskia sp. TaxID=1929292 RepID=UPI0025F48D78|nr:hypothetical protein [Nevskia sp.]
MNLVISGMARVIGAFLLCLGAAALIVVVLLLKRRLGPYPGQLLPVLGALAVCGLVSVFSLSVGYRFTFAKPNLYGSALSPTGWVMASFPFIAFGATGIWLAVTTKQWSFLLVVGACALLAYRCIRASKLVKARTNSNAL